MKKVFKQLMFALADFVSFLWRLLPRRLREMFLMGLFILESRGNSAQGLRRLFLLQDRLELVINERAMAYGHGTHPKHYLTHYHDFFVQHIPKDARVLDIGCGYGAVAQSIAKNVPGCTVIGVELSEERLARARMSSMPDNLTFVHADARYELPNGSWDVVILSNILEHIEDRVGFLQDIIRQVHPKTVLIRVPLFERDWKLPLRRELGVNYFSDPEHFIEHQLYEFHDEISRAGLKVVEEKTLWGEIWAVCECSA